MNVEQLRKAAASWRTAMLEIGTILNALKENGEPVDILRESVLREEFGMPMTTSLVAMRWAAGEYGPKSEEIVKKVPASVLSKMDSSAIASITSGKHTIYSPVEKRVVSKHFDAMTRDEVTKNITPVGFRPMQSQDRPYRCCVASHIEHEGEHLYVVVKGTSPIRVRLSGRVLRELQKEMEAVC